MYKFHVLEGKKLINYKPTNDHYFRALNKIMDDLKHSIGDVSLEEWKERCPEKFTKYLYLIVKFTPKSFDYRRKYTADEIAEWFGLVDGIGGMIALLTPRELMQMFPITKEYDGKKYGMKDYFFTVNVIDQKGIDNPIEEPYDFLFDYMNTDTQVFMCSWTAIINRGYQLQGGRDILLDFFEELGTPLTTYHQNEGYLVNDETGEKSKIEKQKNKLKKLFSVV